MLQVKETHFWVEPVVAEKSFGYTVLLERRVRPWARGQSGTRGGGGDAVLGEEGRAARIRLQPAGSRTLRPRGQDRVVLSVDVQGQTSLIFEAGSPQHHQRNRLNHNSLWIEIPALMEQELSMLMLPQRLLLMLGIQAFKSPGLRLKYYQLTIVKKKKKSNTQSRHPFTFCLASQRIIVFWKKNTQPIFYKLRPLLFFSVF